MKPESYRASQIAMKSRRIIAILTLFLAGCATSPPPWQRGNDSFAMVQLGLTTRADLLRQLGPPDDTMFLQLRDLTVWSYRYKESGVWDSMMHIMLDRNGIVRETMSGPDPEKEERRRF